MYGIIWRMIMDFKEAYDKLREAKREALANSSNIKVGRRELNKALEVLGDKIKQEMND